VSAGRPKLYGVDAAARRLGVAPDTVAWLVRTGRVRTSSVGPVHLVDEADVRAFVERVADRVQQREAARSNGARLGT
jgi:hypothetical protein